MQKEDLDNKNDRNDRNDRNGSEPPSTPNLIRQSKILSPVYSLGTSYFIMGVVMLSFYFFGFFTDNTYFSWGPPVTFFYHTINDNTTFYILLVLLFIYQIITNWSVEVILSWNLHTIQNRRHNVLDYNKKICLTIINLHSLYTQVHLAFIVTSLISQISFLVVLIAADLITLSYINYEYMKDKIYIPENEDDNADIESQV